MEEPIIYILLVYAVIRLLYIIWPKYSSTILTIMCILLCGYELYVGLAQLLGFRSSNHLLYLLTGSFDNPGPYGGFLTIVICILGASHISGKDNLNNNLVLRTITWAAMVVVSIAIIIIPLTQSRTAILALGCSSFLFAVGTRKWRIRLEQIINKFGILILLIFAFLCVSAYLFKKPSADGRIFMDKICMRVIRSGGWKGVGTGHFGGSYSKAQTLYFKEQIDGFGKDDLDWESLNERERMAAECPDNAFNEYLFIGVEAGPIVMFLFVGVIIAAIIISFKRRTIWCYGLTAYAVFAFFSYPLHVMKLSLLLPILISACISDGQPIIKNSIYKVRVAFTASLFFAMVSVLLITHQESENKKRAEEEWNAVKRWHKMEYYDYVVKGCDSLFYWMKDNSSFLFAYGQSLNKTGNYEKSDSILSMGAEISSDPMFWNVMGNNSLALGRFREAEDRYKTAFYMVPNRLYPLYLLAKLYYTEGDTIRFTEMANIVYTFIPKVESILTDNMRTEIKELELSLSD